MKSWKFLLSCILVLFLIQDSISTGHKHKKDKDDDDFDEDDDPGCYPGRNCRPGCYCTGGKKYGYCRPYYPPENEYLKKYACTGYNYPRGWKKGSKEGENSTVPILIAHHSEESNPDSPAFLKESNYTTNDTFEMPVVLESESSTIGTLSSQGANNSTVSIMDITYTSSVSSDTASSTGHNTTETVNMQKVERI